MQHAGGRILLSPSDLANFVDCDHLTELDVAAALGEQNRPRSDDPYADLIRRKGDEHEHAYLEALRAGVGTPVRDAPRCAGRDAPLVVWMGVDF